MKIENIKVIVTSPGRNYVVVKIETDEGIYGIGDATLNGRELTVAETIEEYIAPILIGRNSDNIEDIWQYLYKGAYWRGGPVLMTALAGIDMALWDLKGKRCSRPVYSLLGGRSREKVLCYTHVSGDKFQEVKENALEKIAEGYKVLRVQVSIPGLNGTYGTVEDDARVLPFVETWDSKPYLKVIPELFKFLRAEIGDEVHLIHDSHERLQVPEAIRLAKELEEYNLFFLEDLLKPENIAGFEQIRNQTSIPLAMGELFNSKWEALPLIKNQLIDYIRCDLSHIGGITEAMKLAALAETFHLKTAWHGPADISPIAHLANLHVDYAVSNFGIQELAEFPEEVSAVFKGGPKFEDGYLTIPDRPGLGCDIDEEAAKKFPYKKAYLPVAESLDGSVHEW
ncbi:D-galactonate dehydratase family protein [Halanaerobiaceae bacterium Z-7014]|uniref:D-galactonate dehydratase family protein n=1 Tax=Halonatronomonas betaini TaxID=2778430 RepID=A0A931AQZ0_9FIRM|nr:D-galactonate dehydratase family protein [Halonatronomonas betaini]MBF8436206.1 D-galactonate dehydratase family protein [Halonatronomonas betaini]